MTDAGVLAARERYLRDRRKRAVKSAAPASVPAADERAYRVLHMDERAEEAACRFMDAGWHGRGERPSSLWITAWCLLGTSHMPLLPVFRVEDTPDRLDLPCSRDAILAYAARPSLTCDEAEHRAESFCQRALDRARQLYREGFHADPFAVAPARREMAA